MFSELSKRLIVVVLALGLIWSSCASQKAGESGREQNVVDYTTPQPSGTEVRPAAGPPAPAVTSSTPDSSTANRQSGSIEMKSIEFQKPVPSFALPDLNGKIVSSSDYFGKQVVLVVFWDPDIQESVRQLGIIFDKLKSKPIPKVRIFSIIPRPRKNAATSAGKTAKSKKFDFPILFDENKAVAKAFYVTNKLPVFYIVDAKGLLESFGVIDITAVFGQKKTFYDILAMTAAGTMPNPEIWYGPSFCDMMGEKAHGFSLKDRYGLKTYSLSDYKGKIPLLLIFWSPTCPHCHKELLVLSQYYYAKKSLSNFEFLSFVYIPDDKTREVFDQYIKVNPVPFPVLIDPTGKVFGDFKITGVPAFGVFDKGGVMRYCHSGFIPDTVKVLDDAFAKVK